MLSSILAFFIALVLVSMGAALFIGGYRFFLTLMPLFGFVVGLWVGADLVAALLNEGLFASFTGWVFGLLLGITVAGLAYFFYRLSLISLGVWIGYSLSAALLTLLGVESKFWIALLSLFVGAGFGFVAQSVTVNKIVLVLMTAVAGAFCAVAGLLVLFGGTSLAALSVSEVSGAIERSQLWFAVWVVFTLAGIGIQLFSTRDYEMRAASVRTLALNEEQTKSWSLARDGLKILRRDPKLFFFPAVSAGFALFLIIALGGFMYTFQFLAIISFGRKELVVLAIIFTFAYHLLLRLVVTLNNAALIAAAQLRMDGQTPSLTAGVNRALKQLGPILQYALLGGTLGVLFRGPVGAMMFTPVTSRLAGMSWSNATFLVLPIILNENLNLPRALKRNIQYLKENFGAKPEREYHAGAIVKIMYVIFGLLGLLVLLLAFSLAVPLLSLSTFMGLFFALMLLWSANATFDSLFGSAVYEYLCRGKLMPEYEPSMIRNAFHNIEPDKS